MLRDRDVIISLPPILSLTHFGPLSIKYDLYLQFTASHKNNGTTNVGRSIFEWDAMVIPLHKTKSSTSVCINGLILMMCSFGETI